jgi:hypothetical protein
MPARKRKYIQAERAVAPPVVTFPSSRHECWPRYMRLSEAAKYLGHKTHWVLYRRAKNGQIRANKSTKEWTFDRFDLDELWEKTAERVA